MADNGRQQRLPIQPVDEPILCIAVRGADAHWVYDLGTGEPARVPGRRPASYWYKTERTGALLSSASSPRRNATPLPLVNALRDDVKRWREAGYQRRRP